MWCVLCARRESKRERTTTNRALDTNWFSIFRKSKAKQRHENNVVKFFKSLSCVTGCVLSLCVSLAFYASFILTFLCCLVFLHISCTIDAHDVWCGGFYLIESEEAFSEENKFSCWFLENRGEENSVGNLVSHPFELFLLFIFGGFIPILVVDTHKQWFGESEEEIHSWMTIKISYVHVPWDINMFSFSGWGHLYIYVWWTHIFYIVWPVS